MGGRVERYALARRRSFFVVVLVGSMLLGLLPSASAWGVAGATSAQGATASGSGGTIIGPVTPSHFNGSVRDLPTSRGSSPRQIPEGVDPPGFKAPPVPALDGPARRGSEVTASTASLDAPADNDAVTPAQFTSLRPDFEGLSGSNPPDPSGDVGPNHYVEMINSQFAIWNKSNIAAGPITPPGTANINSLWNDSNPATNSNCERNNQGDPIVVYDQLADRWLLSQFAFDLDTATPPNPIAPFAMCVAISQTPDPTGSYHLYEFPTTVLPDYPKFGIWPDGYYMTTHEGDHGVYVLDRANMLNGNPAVMIRQAITNVGGGRGARLLPSDWDGATAPPVGEPNHLVRSVDGEVNGGADRLEFWDATTNWQANPPTLTLSAPFTLTPAGFDTQFSDCFTANRACVPQPGTTVEIDNLSNRLMWRLQYRNFGTYQTMVVNQTVDFNDTDRSSIRWYEFRKSGAGNWAIHQQGTYSPDAVNRFMGSMAMDGAGNIAVGYTATWDDPTDVADVFNSVRYTGRLASDPLGLLPATEVVMQPGTVSKIVTPPTPPRWGDYTQMSVDPVDDCTFWYVGQYNVNQTRIGSFKFPSCNPADLRITKTDSPDPVNAGEQLTYTINVTNAGPNTAFGATVTDVLPAGVTFLSSAPTCTNAAGTLTCPLGDLLSGQTVQLVIQVDVPSGFLGTASTATITNTATVAAADQTDPNPVNNTAKAVTTVKSLADLAVTKVCKPDDPAVAGSQGFCDIHVDNLGPSDAVGVNLRDVLTSATPFSVVSVTASPSGTCTPPSSGPVTSFTTNCDLGTEPAGGRTTIHVVVTANDVAQVNDVATVTSTTPDPNASNNQATGRIVFTALADLSLDKTGPASVTAGTQLTYVISVTNSGPSAAQAVVVRDTLPLGVSFVSVTPSQGTCTNGQPGARDMVCGLGTMASGATATITVVGLVSPDVAPGTILFNQAIVSSATADPDNDDVRDSVGTTVVADADLSITKTDSPDPVVAGSLLTYTVTVSNAGPSTAQQVVITDDLPNGTTFVTGKDANGSTVCTLVQTGDVVCALGSMSPGTSKTVYITVKVAASVPKGQALVNTATVSSATPDSDPGDNTTSATTAVDTSAELWLDKKGERRSGNPSPMVVYTLTVHNDQGCETDAQSTPTPTCGQGGPSDAQNVVVTDKLPLDSKKVVVQYVSPQCLYTKATHTVVCTAATVPAGASVSFVVEAQISGSVGNITNTATLTSATFDPVTANNTNAVSLVMKGGTGKP